MVATAFYPGGSQVDKNAPGFSWAQNYWCNLLNETAINGQPNKARPVALLAMLVLCISLTSFWWLFPQHAPLSKTSKRLIQAFGVLSMATSVFLFTAFHDIIINSATLFGLVAVVGTFIGLWKLKWIVLFFLGTFTIVLVALNNILYYGDGLRFYLPVVQKITFLYFLVWISAINIKLFRNAQLY